MEIDPRGTLMVHLSARAIGEVDGRGDAVLDALMAYMAGGLLVLPAHSWANVNEKNPVMDVLLTPSCVGIVPELFRRRPGVRRSLHPTHSVAAFGAGADAFVRGDELARSPCPEGSTYYRLYERGAQILLIGVDFTRNTYIHGIEEWDGATGTLAEAETMLYVIDEAGNRLRTPQRRHCAPLGSETFAKVQPVAAREGCLREGRFGDAKALIADARGLRHTMARILAIDPGVLLHNEPLDERFLRRETT